MKPRAYFLICATGISIMWGCSKKITNDTVNILAPGNNSVISSNAVTFWWDPVDGADSYNIQIVQPSFTAVQTLIADTSVTTNKLLLSLNPGTYQWRIKGVNGGGNTKTTVFNFKIDSTSNLTSQLVVPIGPVANFITSRTNITFSWNPVAAATDYEIDINGGASEIDVHTGISTSYQATFTAGSYAWKVKALNGFSISQFSTPRAFKVDQTMPNAPSNLAINSIIVASAKITDTLSWHRNSTDIQYDSLYLYNDPNLASVTASGTLAVTKINVGHFVPPLTTTLSLPFWWRVKSIDSVGNRSFFSTAATFTLTP